MTTIRAAFYARVSGEQHAAAHAIDSQIAALSEPANLEDSPLFAKRHTACILRAANERLVECLGKMDDLSAVSCHLSAQSRGC
jgi:hypothetical protein